MKKDFKIGYCCDHFYILLSDNHCLFCGKTVLTLDNALVLKKE